MTADQLRRVWGLFQSEKIGQENLLEHLRRLPIEEQDTRLFVLTENLIRDTKEVLAHLDEAIALKDPENARG